MGKEISKEEKLLKLADKLIFGVGGLQDYKKYEVAIWSGKKGLEEAYWTLKCIVNNKEYLDKLKQLNEQAKLGK